MKNSSEKPQKIYFADYLTEKEKNTVGVTYTHIKANATEPGNLKGEVPKAPIVEPAAEPEAEKA